MKAASRFEEVLNVWGYRLTRAGSRCAETMKFMCRRREWIKKININLESKTINEFNILSRC